MERKVATVLFADLVGSTELGEQDPERTRVLLDRFFTAMAEEVERVDGLEQFVPPFGLDGLAAETRALL